MKETKQSKIEAAPKRKRLTAAQRRERDFWLGCAERAHDALHSLWVHPFLCNWAARAGEPAYVERLQLFRPDADIYAWWETEAGVVSPYGHGPAEGRVLAACFLAAMAELGGVGDGRHGRLLRRAGVGLP